MANADDCALSFRGGEFQVADVGIRSFALLGNCLQFILQLSVFPRGLLRILDPDGGMRAPGEPLTCDIS